MEQQITAKCCRGGYVLVAVLIMAAVGLLFGAGSLLLFKYQCQLRVERQHELEKVYAVRSALNLIKGKANIIPAEGKSYGYRTWSERDLKVIVKPVAPIFPCDEQKHLFLNYGQFEPHSKSGGYNAARDYEFGFLGPGSFDVACKAPESLNGGYGLSFYNQWSTNVKWWVNIGMPGTGGWLQEEYGRRYYFHLQNYFGAEDTDSSLTNDVFRLALIRNVTNNANSAGCRLGWPLSKVGERALVFQIRPLPKGDSPVVELMLYELQFGGVGKVLYLSSDDEAFPNPWPIQAYAGLQISNDKASIFYIDAYDDGTGENTKGYTFTKVVELSSETYDYFANEQWIGDKCYSGIETNSVTGEVSAPELRAVFEVEALSSKRDGVEKSTDAKHGIDTIRDFRVTPAYQFDVFVEYPSTVTNRATVAQRVGKQLGVNLKDFSVRTYDTHGTDNKGFRKDEKDFAERRNGR